MTAGLRMKSNLLVICDSFGLSASRCTQGHLVNIIRKLHLKAHAKSLHSPAASWVALSIGFVALALIGLPN
jgi:hypothetical protein